MSHCRHLCCNYVDVSGLWNKSLKKKTPVAWSRSGIATCLPWRQLKNIKQIPQKALHSFGVFIELQQALKLPAYTKKRSQGIRQRTYFSAVTLRERGMIVLTFIDSRQGWERGDSRAVFLSTCWKNVHPLSSKGREVNGSGLMNGCQGSVSV